MESASWLQSLTVFWEWLGQQFQSTDFHWSLICSTSKDKYKETPSLSIWLVFQAQMDPLWFWEASTLSITQVHSSTILLKELTTGVLLSMILSSMEQATKLETFWALSILEHQCLLVLQRLLKIWPKLSELANKNKSIVLLFLTYPTLTSRLEEMSILWREKTIFCRLIKEEKPSASLVLWDWICLLNSERPSFWETASSKLSTLTSITRTGE